MQLKELTRAEEAAERLSAEYEKKLLLLQQKESLELVKVSITSRRQAARGREGGCCFFSFLVIFVFFSFFSSCFVALVTYDSPEFLFFVGESRDS